MATKKCANGHLYDPAIYGDKCPFCPSPTGSTKVNTDWISISKLAKVTVTGFVVIITELL